MDTPNSITMSQPSLKGAKAPPGHIILNLKHNGSPLSRHLQDAGLKLLYDDSISIIDCYPSSRCALLIAMETDLINQDHLAAKIKKLSKFGQQRILLVEETDSSRQYVRELQIELALSGEAQLIIVNSLKDIALVVAGLVHTENHSNPYTQRPKQSVTPDESLLSFVKSLPGVGDKKALELLKRFQSFHGIATASEADLAAVVGKSSASQLHQMLSGT